MTRAVASLVALLAFSASGALRTMPAEGLVRIAAGDAFPSGTAIGPKAAVAVDVSGVKLEAGREVGLFQARGLTLAEGESLEDCVFPSGPAFDGTLSYDDATGWVKAKVGNVLGDAVAKVSVWGSGNVDEDTPKQYWDHIGDGTWSDGIPGFHDTAVFFGDNFAYGYRDRVPAFKALAIRGGKVTFKSGSKWPMLHVRQVVGTGTLALASTGLETSDRCDCTVGRNVTIEAAYFSPDQDAWVRGNRGKVIVNGPVVMREGFLKVYRDVEFNGPITVDSLYGAGLVVRDSNCHIRGDLILSAPFTVASGNSVDGRVIMKEGGVLMLGKGVPVPSVEGWEGISVSVRKVKDDVIISTLFWTTGRIVLLVVGFLVIILAMMLLAYVLGKMVMRRTQQLKDTMRDREIERVAYDASRRERLRLAHDLHDDFQQLLTSARFRLIAGRTFVEEGAKDEAVEQFDAARIALDHAQTGLRATLWTMNEESEGPGSLLDLFRHAIGRMEHWKGIVEFTQEGAEPKLARQLMGRMLMILQEAVGNAITHGDATKVYVKVTFGEGDLVMTITDNGEGFDPASVSDARGHFGIRGMKARAQEGRGSLVIESAPGKGTVVTVRLAY